MLVVCVGTGTDVGKTWVGANVLTTLRKAGVSVSARKLVQSFDPAANDPTDADVLAGATGDRPTEVCPAHRWLELPMAPPMAAETLGRATFTLSDLIIELAWPDPLPDVRWVESVGGVRSPLAVDADSVDLCAALAPDLVVLVAPPDLGVINLVRLCMGPLSLWPVVVVLNPFEESQALHRLNRAWLRERDGLEVMTGPADLVRRLASQTVPHG
jgi:dethiobiotin synthetase